jgi:hypothetical protein
MRLGLIPLLLLGSVGTGFSQMNCDSGQARASSVGEWKTSGAPSPYGMDSGYWKKGGTYAWLFQMPAAWFTTCTCGGRSIPLAARIAL